MLRERHITIATAESCTGGLVAHTLTNTPGSSAYMVGGIIAYSNTIKEQILGVPGSVLAECGAVSSEVAEMMARSVRECFQASVGVAVTGIAGPEGGSQQKAARYYLDCRCPGK